MSEEQRKYLKLVFLISFKMIGVKNAAIGRMKKQSVALRRSLMSSAQSNSRRREKMEIAHIAIARKIATIECLITETAFFDISYHLPKNGGGFGS